MIKKLPLTIFLIAVFIFFPIGVKAAAPAYRILPNKSEAVPPSVIFRLSSVTSDDGKRAIIAWETEDLIGVRPIVTCSWSARGSGKIIVSSRAGWSHKVSCDGKPTRVGIASAHAPTIEIYYSGASHKGLKLSVELTTAGGFITPFGERVFPRIDTELTNKNSAKATTDKNIIVPSDEPQATFDDLIPEGFQDIIKQSPFYKYLNNSDLSKYGM